MPGHIAIHHYTFEGTTLGSVGRLVVKTFISQNLLFFPFALTAYSYSNSHLGSITINNRLEREKKQTKHDEK